MDDYLVVDCMSEPICACGIPVDDPINFGGVMLCEQCLAAVLDEPSLEDCDYVDDRQHDRDSV